MVSWPITKEYRRILAMHPGFMHGNLWRNLERIYYGGFMGSKAVYYVYGPQTISKQKVVSIDIKEGQTNKVIHL